MRILKYFKLCLWAHYISVGQHWTAFYEAQSNLQLDWMRYSFSLKSCLLLFYILL